MGNVMCQKCKKSELEPRSKFGITDDRVFPHHQSTPPANIYFGDRYIFVPISQTLALLEIGMLKGEGFGYDTGCKDT